ncbi:type II 3-dehydroquinate dehydratase [Micromonospora sp. NPDC047134]|uniref:type II 3-dehydroquinate dehydratase n=1 Tax=Micromonospora sp. NPDC047134 TaxID=3154340 RepID=UPI0033E80696
MTGSDFGHAGDILLLNGPNLAQLGTRKPEVYGTTTLAEIEKRVAEFLGTHGYRLTCVQSEDEGDLVRAVHRASEHAAAIVNPGALMMAGWSLRDALEMFEGPWIEVHLSNVWARESFRHTSVLSPLATGVICGLRAEGYLLAARALVDLLATQR